MNAAHQQGYNANAMADADAELIDAADPPQLPAPRAQNPTAIATIWRFSDAFGGEDEDEDDQAASAAGPPPAVDSRESQRTNNQPLPHTHHYQYNKHNKHLKMGHCIKLHTSHEQQCSARMVLHIKM